MKPRLHIQPFVLPINKTKTTPQKTNHLINILQLLLLLSGFIENEYKPDEAPLTEESITDLSTILKTKTLIPYSGCRSDDLQLTLRRINNVAHYLNQLCVTEVKIAQLIWHLTWSQMQCYCLQLSVPKTAQHSRFPPLLYFCFNLTTKSLLRGTNLYQTLLDLISKQGVL